MFKYHDFELSEKYEIFYHVGINPMGGRVISFKVFDGFKTYTFRDGHLPTKPIDGLVVPKDFKN